MAMSDYKPWCVKLISAFFVGAFVFLAAISLYNRRMMVLLFSHLSFYFIAALVGLWFFLIVTRLKLSGVTPLSFIRSHWSGILLAVGMTILIFTSVPVCFKVLNDETNLLAVSQSMFYFKEAYRISGALNYHGALHPVLNEIPIRPLLFPFATFLMHVISGYHWQNPFVVNFLTMIFFLIGVYAVSMRYTDTWTSSGAVILICSYPIFTIYGTSGSYDLFSAFFFFLSMALLFLFLESPTDIGFALLWTNLLMFMNIRCESIIFFFLIIPVAAWWSRKAGCLNRKYFYVYAATPLFMLPYFWQLFLSRGNYENPPGVMLFSIHAFAIHLKVLVENFLNLDFLLPYNGISNLLSLICGVYLLSSIVQKKIIVKKEHFLFWALFSASTIAMMVIILSHFLGVYNHPTQARLFLCFSIVCALAPVMVKAVSPKSISSKGIFALSIILFIIYHPIASKHEFINRLLTSRIQHESWKVLKNYAPDDVLILSAWSGQYSACNYSSLPIWYANSRFPHLIEKLKDHRYQKIILIQETDAATGAVKFNNQVLSHKVNGTILRQAEVIPGEILRISQITFNNL